MSGPIQNTHPTTPPPPRIEPSRGEPSRAQGAGQVQPQGGNVTIPSATPGYEQQYEVRQGDTLSAIARRHNVSLDELLKANPQFDPSSVGNGIDFNRGAVGTWDADAIFVGDKIHVPTAGPTPAPAPAPTPAPTPAPAPAPPPPPAPAPPARPHPQQRAWPQVRHLRPATTSPYQHALASPRSSLVAMGQLLCRWYACQQTPPAPHRPQCTTRGAMLRELQPMDESDAYQSGYARCADSAQARHR